MRTRRQMETKTWSGLDLIIGIGLAKQPRSALSFTSIRRLGGGEPISIRRDSLPCCLPCALFAHLHLQRFAHPRAHQSFPVLSPARQAASGHALSKIPPRRRTTRPKLLSKCNLTAIRVQSGGKEPLRPTRCRSRPIEGPKSNPGREIRPRLQLSIESGFLYTPPTANVAIRLPARSACVGSDRLGNVRWADRLFVGGGALVRSGERPFARLHRYFRLARPGCVL